MKLVTVGGNRGIMQGLATGTGGRLRSEAPQFQVPEGITESSH
jgi:hypothetical protein